jgi:hypothetical protein
MGETLDAEYATMSEAIASGAVSRGWVPNWIPPAASHIREVHNLDTNESALVFRVASSASWRPPAHCRSARGGELSQPAFRRAWVPSSSQLAEKFAFYACGDDGTPPLIEAVAISKADGQVLHWRTYAR